MDRKEQARLEFQAEQQARIDYHETHAGKNRVKAKGRFAAADQIAHFTQGEPVKVGHHSEGRHRRDLARMDGHMRAGLKHEKTASYHDEKAASVGKGGIRSHDPDAIDKLREKLEGLEAERDRKKALNKLIRKHGLGHPDVNLTKKDEADLRWSHKTAKNGDPLFPSYVFQNLGGNIRRIKARIADLESSTAIPERDTYAGTQADVYDYPDRNTTAIDFGSKPPQEIRQKMKRRGFKWARSYGQWLKADRSDATWDFAIEIANGE